MKWLTFALLVPLLASGCAPVKDQVESSGSNSATTNTTGEETVEENLKADLELLASTQLFFGHQSVGFNLLDGISDHIDEQGNPDLRIAAADEPPADGEPGIYHSLIGANTEPKAKIDDFVHKVRAISETPPAIALMKLCYVDFLPKTDVDHLFSYYKTAMEELKTEHPGITFVHVTVPLTTRSSLLKRLAYRVMGRRSTSDVRNMRRNEYNEQLLKEFPADPIFDLARIESTSPDGSRTSFRVSGRSYFALAPKYTDDGGHLNENGRYHASGEMVRVLADVVRARTEGRPQ